MQLSRAMELNGGFGLDRLGVVERAERPPGAGEVRLAVRAVSLNRRDLLLVQGIYNPNQALPIVPCSDASGVVESVGEGCRRVKAGDRVVLHMFPGWIAGGPTTERLGTALGGAGGDGTLREHMTVPEAAVLKLPETIGFDAAATLPCAALTAWSAVCGSAGARPGDVVLIQGTGGVSIFALQFAKRAGARVVATTTTEAKAARLRDLGADAVVYRSDPDWPRLVRAAADGPVDLVVDVGGAGSLDASLRIIRPGGTIALVGVLSGANATIPLPLAVMRQVRLQGVTCGNRDAFEAMLRAVALHGIDPVISDRFQFGEAPAAFSRMETNGHFGKIVIRIGGMG